MSTLLSNLKKNYPFLFRKIIIRCLWGILILMHTIWCSCFISILMKLIKKMVSPCFHEDGSSSYCLISENVKYYPFESIYLFMLIAVEDWCGNLQTRYETVAKQQSKQRNNEGTNMNPVILLIWSWLCYSISYLLYFSVI